MGNVARAEVIAHCQPRLARADDQGVDFLYGHVDGFVKICGDLSKASFEKMRPLNELKYSRHWVDFIQPADVVNAFYSLI